jgi:hypothetical protein
VLEKNHFVFTDGDTHGRKKNIYIYQNKGYVYQAERMDVKNNIRGWRGKISLEKNDR